MCFASVSMDVFCQNSYTDTCLIYKAYRPNVRHLLDTLMHFNINIYNITLLL